MNFADRVKSFLGITKSLNGEGNGDPSEGKNEPDKNQDGAGGTEGGEGVNKSDLVDATEILGDLVNELRDINKSLKAVIAKQETLEKSQSDVGEAVVAVSEVVGKIAGIPVSTKSVMAKGNLGAAPASGFTKPVMPPKTPPTQAEFERAQKELIKSVNAGEITMIQSEMISSDMQKSMAIPGYTMKPENYEFLAHKMQAVA